MFDSSKDKYTLILPLFLTVFPLTDIEHGVDPLGV
jgi:hypothetical protein